MEWFEQCWPYLAIFGTLFFTGIGLPPLPEEVPIIGAGIAANHQELAWWIAWPACVLGIVIADLVLYWAGRLWGKSILRWRWVKRILPPERREELEDGFHRHGVKILLTGRLLPGLRTGVFLTAGAMHYPFLRFLLADGLYAIPGVGLIFFGSYFLTESFTLLLGEVDRVRYWLLVIALLGGAGYLCYKFWRFRSERVAFNDFTPPTLPELVRPTGSHHGSHPHKAAPPGSSGTSSSAAPPKSESA